MRKGVSEIIATILMLLITVGLAGTAFIYIQSSLLGRTQKQITLADVSCSATSNTIYVTVKNLDSQLSINPTSDLLVRLDSVPAIPSGWTPTTIPAAQPNQNSNSVGTISCANCTSGTIHSVKVIGPSNTVDGQAIC